MSEIPQKKCKKCKATYDIDFFAKSNKDYYRDVCCICHGKTTSKICPWHSKAYSSIRSHKNRWRESWGPKPESTQEFYRLYGWHLPLIAKNMKSAYEGSCWYCHTPYKEIGDGTPANLTLDIINPDNKPYYETNVVHCCHSCNAQKQDKNADEWGRWLRNMQKHKAVTNG